MISLQENAHAFGIANLSESLEGCVEIPLGRLLRGYSTAREALSFHHPLGLSRVAHADSDGLFAPGTSFAVLSQGDSNVASDALLTLSVACAREGARVLFIGDESFGAFAARLVSNVSGVPVESLSSEGNPRVEIARTTASYISMLPIFYARLQNMQGEHLTALEEQIDPDLIVLDGFNRDAVSAYREISDKTGVPLLFCCGAAISDSLCVCELLDFIPTHILLIDFAMPEDGDELVAEFQSEVAECRLLISDESDAIMRIPFLGTFRLLRDFKRCRVLDYYDEYSGHVLTTEIDRLKINDIVYDVVEPDHYMRRLELYYDVR